MTTTSSPLKPHKLPSAGRGARLRVQSLAVCCVAAIALGLLSPNSSYADALWQSPHGDFSVTLPPDWEMIPTGSDDSRTLANDTRMILSTASAHVFAGGDGTAECSIAQLNEIPTAADQQVINDSGATQTEEGVRARLPPGATIRSFSNEIRDGVRVVSYITDTAVLGRVEGHTHVFAIVRNRTARMYATYCTLLLPASPEDAAAAVNLLGSLNFHAEGAQ